MDTYSLVITDGDSCPMDVDILGTILIPKDADPFDILTRHFLVCYRDGKSVAPNLRDLFYIVVVALSVDEGSSDIFTLPESRPMVSKLKQLEKVCKSDYYIKKLGSVYYINNRHKYNIILFK